MNDTSLTDGVGGGSRLERQGGFRGSAPKHKPAAGAEEKKGFAAVRRSWRLAELLVRRFADGMSNSEIAEALGEARPTVSRDLDVLREEGIVHKLDNGRWALTSKPMGLFRACMLAQEREQARLSEGLRNIDARARMLAGEE